MSPPEVEAIIRALARGNRLPMSRHDGLPRLWRQCGYTRGAEIGVEQGRYSETLLHAMPDLHLVLVDAWRAYPAYREHVSQAKLDGFYADTMRRVSPYANRVGIMRDWSVTAAAEMPDASLDFVFIDGNHRYAQVMADLAAWTPKVKAGGMISGHDYGRRSVGEVAEAVQDWTRAHQIASWWVTEGDKSPSWLWVQHG